MSLLFDAEAAAEQLRSADDAELLERSRRGDSLAFAELFRRYRPIALMVAARTSSALDPEDVSSEAFTRVWRALRNGGGPSTAFRPYLSTSVRNVALNWRRGPQEVPLEPQAMAEVADAADDTEVALAEAELIGRAFGRLPARWQEVLWASEVEGVSTAELARRMGTSNNATAALCLRAREGLRNAWLAEHIDRRATDPECRWVLEHLSGYARQRLPQAQQQRVAAHLPHCRTCRRAASRLDRVVAVLRISVLAGGTTIGLLTASSLVTGVAAGKVAAASLRPSSWVANAAKMLFQPQVGLAAVVATVAVGSLSLGLHFEASASAAGLAAPRAAVVVSRVTPGPSADPEPEPSAPSPTAPAAAQPTAAELTAPRPSSSVSPSPSPEPSASAAPTTPSSTAEQTPSLEPTADPSVSPTAQPSSSASPVPTLTPAELPPATSSADPSATTSAEPSVSASAEPSATPSGPEPSSIASGVSPSPTMEPSPSSVEPSPTATIGPTDSIPRTESASPTASATPSAPPSETATPQPSPTPSCVLIWDFILRIGICQA
jgi:RNA polymerase sigma factor, sigma-70 family